MSIFEKTNIADSQGNTINPTKDENLNWIRRALKFLESLGNVDIAGRQRVSVDAITATLTNVTTVGTISTITGGTITTITNNVPVGTVATVTNVAGMIGMDQRMFWEQSRMTYNIGIRNQLSFK